MNTQKIIEKTISSQTPKYLRIAYLFELMNIADKQSVDTICYSAKNDPCELVRHEAIFALGETASLEVINFLKKCIEQESSYVVKHEALVSLGTIGTTDDIPFIENYCNDKSEEVASSGIIAIQRINQEKDFENKINNNLQYYQKLLFDYQNSTQNQRIQILFQVMKKADVESVEIIGKVLLNDPCRVVRHEAGFALGEIGTQFAIEKMKESMESEKIPIVQHETLFALGTTGKTEALPIIEKFLDHTETIVKDSAIIGKDRITQLDEPYSGIKHFPQ